MSAIPELPPGVTVFERGWLSANGILFQSDAQTALVDTGYCSHQDQTVSLLRHALDDRALDLLLNTHLHSDHCGGNAAIQARYPGVKTFIPPGESKAVEQWDENLLSYRPTGQRCERFRFDGVLKAGGVMQLAHARWEIHAAPGHDPHSIILFEPQSRSLISADALWQNGFGVVFPELVNEPGFDEVGATLDLIEQLDPAVVIPGHGAVFSEVAPALATARKRLDQFSRDPVRHASHAAKVLLKFKLLELQAIELDRFLVWASATPYLGALHRKHFDQMSMNDWLLSLIDSLEHSGVAGIELRNDVRTLVNR